MKQYPVNYISITQGYTNNHKALDLGWKNNPDVPILACDNGVVEKVYYIDDGGNVVRIKYNDGIVSEFMHLKNNSIIVKEGQKVSKGEMVATMGDTGLTTGPHLHVIIKDKNGNRQNPLDYLYAYPEQEVSSKDINKIMKYVPETEYVVMKGDTLSSIAERYNTTYHVLAQYNNIENPNLIYPNQIIKIPNNDTIIYTVKKGDTLSSIAEKYNITWKKIYEQNKEIIGPNPNLIKQGQQLIIYLT